MLELDSSTPAKFSRHVVVRTPGAAFRTNAHVGAFVREVCGADEAQGPAEELLIAKVDWISKECVLCVHETRTLKGVFGRGAAHALHLQGTCLGLLSYPWSHLAF